MKSEPVLLTKEDGPFLYRNRLSRTPHLSSWYRGGRFEGKENPGLAHTEIDKRRTLILRTRQIPRPILASSRGPHSDSNTINDKV